MESRVIDELYRIVLGRKMNPVEGSYTCHLLAEGTDNVLKKISEEATEVILASKSGKREETIYELADLFYHIIVLMGKENIRPSEVFEELKRRMIK